MKNAFATKQDAVNFLINLGMSVTSDGRYYMQGTYVTKHGEYDRPDYAPRKYKDGWGIHAAYFYYQGTLHAPKDGRIDISCMMDMYADEA